MLKKIVFISFMLLVNLNLFAQSIEFNNKRDSVIYYNSLINKAELSICDSNYLDANNLYKIAFQYLLPFPEDIYNASISAIYSNDFVLSIKYCKKLVRIGCNKDFFNQNPYNLVKSNENLWNKFIVSYDSIRNEYENNVNWKLRKKIDDLVKKDQKNYCKINKYGIPVRNPQDSIYNILTGIVDYYGYPTAYLIGINIYNDTLIYDPVDLLLRHYYQENNFRLSPKLFKELFKGKISPVRFVTNEEFKYQPKSFYGTAKLQMDTKGNYYALDEFKNYGKIKNYDINRKKVMMFPYKDEVKKFLFKKNNKKFIIPVTGYFNDSLSWKNKDYRPVNNKSIYGLNISYPKINKIDSIDKYYTFINKAELFICNNNIEKAFEYYKKAFEYNKYPFPDDIYNAALCSIELEKYQQSINYSMKLVELGLSLDFFNKTEFNNLRNNPVIWDEFLERYELGKKKFLGKTNISLRNKIIDLNEHFLNLDKIFFNNNYDLNIEKNKKHKIKDSLYWEVKEIIRKYGFACFNTTGILMNKDSFIQEVSLKPIIGFYYTDGNYDLSEFLKDQVFSGNLQPYRYLKWEGNKYKPIEYFGSDIRIINGYFYSLDTALWKGKILLFNKHRKKLFPFSETYEEGFIKSIFYLNINDINKLLGGKIRIKESHNRHKSFMRYKIHSQGLQMNNNIDPEFLFKKMTLS